MERKTPGLVLSLYPVQGGHTGQEMGTEEEDAYGFFSWALWLGGGSPLCLWE